MFGNRITLFKLLGFEVRIDASWLLVAALITWSLAAGFFPGRFPTLSAGQYWFMGAVSALGLFGSIVVHEFSHSLVARRYGIPMRGITLFIFGGVAEMSAEPRDAKSEFLMAAAGPATSVLLGSIFFAVYHAAAWPPVLAGIIGYLAWINWMLAAFNIIPAFPLDGGRILRSALWHWMGNLATATRIASTVGSAFGLFLMFAAVWQLFRGNFIGAMWWFLLGMFLRQAAWGSYEQLVVRRALEGEPVRRFMKENPVTVSPDISVQDLVDHYIYALNYKLFPVIAPDSSQLVGCVTTGAVKSLPREEWDRHRVSELVQPCSEDNTISPDADAARALAQATRSGQSRLMVVESGRLVGIVALKDLLGFLAAKLDLEDDGWSARRAASESLT